MTFLFCLVLKQIEGIPDVTRDTSAKGQAQHYDGTKDDPQVGQAQHYDETKDDPQVSIT